MNPAIPPIENHRPQDGARKSRSQADHEPTPFHDELIASASERVGRDDLGADPTAGEASHDGEPRGDTDAGNDLDPLLDAIAARAMAAPLVPAPRVDPALIAGRATLPASGATPVQSDGAPRGAAPARPAFPPPGEASVPTPGRPDAGAARPAPVRGGSATQPATAETSSSPASERAESTTTPETPRPAGRPTSEIGLPESVLSRASTAEIRSREISLARADQRIDATPGRESTPAAPVSDRARTPETTLASEPRRAGVEPPIPVAPTRPVEPAAQVRTSPTPQLVAEPASAPPVASTPTAPAPTTSVAATTMTGNPVPVQSILQQVRMQVRSGGVRDLSLRLDPPELGRLTLRFVLDGETLRVMVRANRTEVVAALKAEMSSFQSTLRDAGIDVASLDIDLEHGDHAEGSKRDRGRDTPTPDAAPGDATVAEAPAHRPTHPTDQNLRAASGRIDVLA